MKKEIKIPTLFGIMLVTIFIVGAIVQSIILIRNYTNHKEELHQLVAKEIRGKIIRLENRNRGSFDIDILSESGKSSIKSLQIAWEVEEYGIQIGDSVSKQANNNKITFFRSENGVYKEICQYEI